MRRAFTELTDEGVEHLAKISKLRKLDIAYTKITDRAIGILSRCPNLDELNLQGTRLTAEGIKRLADISTLHGVAFAFLPAKEVLTSLRNVRQLERLEMGYLPRGKPGACCRGCCRR